MMARFTLYRSTAGPTDDITEVIRTAGARVIAARPGLALIEASDAVAEVLRRSLSDWIVTKEVSAKIPRPRPDLPTSKKD